MDLVTALRQSTLTQVHGIMDYSVVEDSCEIHWENTLGTSLPAQDTGRVLFISQ